MPFTAAHPAAVLPLRHLLGRYAVGSALVIGSMAPDLRWLSFGLLQRLDTHSVGALLTFCLPAGLLCFWLFHRFFRAPLLRVLPAAMAARVPPPFRWTWQGLPGVCVSLLAGAASHDLWDAFTHVDGGMLHLPWLAFRVAAIGDYPIHLYSLLQHTSSALGLVVLALWLRNWMRNAPASPPRIQASVLPYYWGAALLLSAVVAALLALALHPVEIHGLRSAIRTGKLIALHAFAGVLAWTLLYCVVWHIAVRVRGPALLALQR